MTRVCGRKTKNWFGFGVKNWTVYKFYIRSDGFPTETAYNSQFKLKVTKITLLAFSDICVPVHSVAGRPRLRSADHGDLIVPRVQTQRYGSRSFRVSGPTVWNSLPQNLRSSDISREQL